MKLPDSAYTENGITYLLTDRELVERVIEVKKGKKVEYEKYSYVVSTRIRAPSIDSDSVQCAEADAR